MSRQRFSLTGRRALITGASRGIGAGLAREFAAVGADVALVARSHDDLEAVAADVRAGGREAIALPCDVCDAEAVSHSVARAWKALDGIDVLVNAAGGPLFQSSIAEIEQDGWNKVIALNLTGVLAMCQQVGPRMAEQGAGSIINIASLLPTRAWPAIAAYSAAKSGVLSLTQSMAMEWGASGVRVNALCPGWIRTSLNHPYLTHEARAKTAIESVPLGRWGEVADVVGTAIWLASEASSYVSGAFIPVDGGLSIGMPSHWLEQMNLAPDP